MKRNRLIITLLLVVMLTVAVTSTALANKRLYKARLSASAELHEVIDSSASGSAIVARRPQGFDFQMFVRGLSGPATAAHIHGPASETETASPVLTLCGGPAPALFATCDSVFDPATGKYQLQIQGSLSPAPGASRRSNLTTCSRPGLPTSTYTSPIRRRDARQLIRQ